MSPRRIRANLTSYLVISSSNYLIMSSISESLLEILVWTERSALEGHEPMSSSATFQIF